jgi:hypothetical protein
MPDIWQFFKNLFQEEVESSPSKPFLHELIERSADEKVAFGQWKQSLTCRLLLDWVHHQYGIWKALPDETSESLDFLDTPSTKGFALHLHKTEYNRTDATHFFDYLKERVLSQNYRTHVSDTRTWTEKDFVQTVERHYLKPKPIQDENGKLLQRFGNITIELTLRNDRPHNLRFRATSYNDRLYHDAEDFGELMGVLFEMV